MSGLWRDHPAAPRQAHFHFRESKSFRRATQADLILSMLRKARDAGKAVELPEIMAAGVAQHGARFNELRSRGFQIENKLERDTAGRVLSRYFLRHDPERDGVR